MIPTFNANAQLQTNLTTEQAVILHYLKIAFQARKIIDPLKVEIDQTSDEEFQAMTIDGYEFSKDGDVWTCGQWIADGGSYWQPPDAEIQIFSQQKPKQHLSSWVIEVLQEIIAMNLENAFSYEAEDVYEHQFRGTDNDYPILN